jgi:glyoxylase-like metal-dependent hydrolase (beta-lactamase superfamily II)
MKRLVCFIAALAAAASLHAADEGPGWYRTKIGGVSVTALWDGTMDLAVDEMFAHPGPAQLKALLARAYLKTTVPMTVNAFVVDDGRRVVLIDTGTGASRMFGDRLGHVQANLRAGGYTPEQIDEIYLTHMHTDHVGGLTLDGRAVYPRAVVRADAREAAHYLSREKLTAAGGDKEDVESAIAMLEPYVRSGRFKPFDGRTALAAGVRALPMHGHTPGPTADVVESDGEKLVLWGDLVHVAAVQFPRPDATVSFEASPSQAAARRAQLYRDVAREGAWIAGAHIGFPGIGKLRAEADGGYTWVPISIVRGR